MTRVVSVFVVVIAVMAATAAVGATPATVDGSVSGQATTIEMVNRSNTSNVLGLATINRSGVTSPDLDLSTALTIQTVRTEWRLTRYVLTDRFNTVESDAERQSVLMGGVRRAERVVADLRTTQQQALEAYRNGSIDGEALLLRLGQIQARGKALEQFISRISSLNEREQVTDVDTIRNQVLRVQAELALIVSPVRTIVADVVVGHTRAPTLFVGVGDSGITLSTVRDGAFIHHTVRLDHFADEPGTSNASEALNRWAELYPTVWDVDRVEFTGLAGAYRAALPFTGGNLVSYLDASRLEVFSETQTKQVTAIPTGPTTSTTREDLVVTVNRTYPGGPLRVTFYTESGQPLDGVVRVNGRHVGTTGDDGILWTIGPADQFALTVDYGTRQVALVVSPIPTT